MRELRLDGRSLTVVDLVRVAREGHPVSIDPGALPAMAAVRDLVVRIAARGDAVYGLTTGVGVRKLRAAPTGARLLREHRTGMGPPLAPDVARASAVLLANTIAAGRTGVRAEVAERLCRTISAGVTPHVRRYGSTGMGDVVPLADLVADLLAEEQILPDEALPLIAQGSVATAAAALALHDALRLLDRLTETAALDLEAFAANPSPLHELVPIVRPYPGLGRAIADLRALLAGSRLFQEEPRHLHAPLAFRCAAHVLGAGNDALAFCDRQVTIELNAHQQNPLLVIDADRAVPVANFDLQPLAQAMDIARLALAPCLTTQLERTITLLQASQTGLTDGLEPYGDPGGHGLSELAWTAQAIAAEARLLVQPVSAEIGSSTQAEGIENRMTLAPLGARRLAEMTDLGLRLGAIAAVVSCQAIDLRGVERLGAPARTLYDRVRSVVASLAPGEPPPADLEPLVALLARA